MKNRIVMFFGRPVTSKDSNILYNSYIKRTIREFLNFIKIFYKIFPAKWFVKNKTVIFAVLITALVVIVNCSMQTRPTPHVVSVNPGIIIPDSDTLRKVVWLKTKHDTVTTAEVDSGVNTAQDVRNLVYEESGLKIPRRLPDAHLWMMYNTAQDYDIPLTIWFRLIYTESVWDVNSTSRSGAQSYLQLMPSTYRLYRRRLNLEKSPKSNINIGAYYLKELYDFWKPKFSGERQRWAMALASYKQGLSNSMARRRTVPSRSVRYVNWILKNGYE